eukprot:364325-Chlamydomonas_euryale.AAC.14
MARVSTALRRTLRCARALHNLAAALSWTAPTCGGASVVVGGPQHRRRPHRRKGARHVASASRALVSRNPLLAS